MTPDRPTACVMGDGDLVRALGLGGVPVALVAPEGSPLLRSRFVRPAFAWSRLWEDAAGLLAALLRYAAAQPSPPVLFYQQDAQLLLLARHGEALRRVFRFVLPDPSLVEQLVDKARFQALADRLGLPVPPARLIAPGDAEAGAGLPFPILVKPQTRDAQWQAAAGRAKAVTAETPEAFATLAGRLAAGGCTVLAQHLIPGPESRIESYHAYVDEDGRIAGEFTGRKIRTWPTRFGHSTALETTEAGDVADLGREVLRRIGFAGVAKLDFKRDSEGRLWLLEINPRFNLWHHLGAVAGVNIPALVFADLAGERRPASGRARAGLRWVQPSQDWRAAREAGIPFPAWCFWMLGCQAKTVAWDDPLPYLVAHLPRRRPAPPVGPFGKAAP